MVVDRRRRRSLDRDYRHECRVKAVNFNHIGSGYHRGPHDQRTATAAATPAPTAASTPAPTATVVAPAVFSGTGDSVVKIPAQFASQPALVLATHNGSANFIVESLDSSNATSGLFVDTIGSYNGMVPVNFTGSSGAVGLKITADGTWTLTFKDASTARPFTSSIAGKGDEVLLYHGNTGTAAITNNGSANFIVTAYGTDGSSPNLLIDEIGHYNGSQPFSSGPMFIVVQADGNWTFAVQ